MVALYLANKLLLKEFTEQRTTKMMQLYSIWQSYV